MMSRKDYRGISEILVEYRQGIEADEFLELCRDFAEYMKRDNPRFDTLMFLKACKAMPQPRMPLGAYGPGRICMYPTKIFAKLCETILALYGVSVMKCRWCVIVYKYTKKVGNKNE